MSVSTDAILFWGIPYGDEEIDRSIFAAKFNLVGDHDDYEWETIYASAVGIREPDEPWSDEPYARQKFIEFWEQKRWQYRASQCEVGTYSSYQYPMYFACVSASIIIARRGSHSEVESISVHPEWRGKLRNFCDILGLPWREPKWTMVSLWG